MDSFAFTQEEVAKRVGKERSTVANSLRLLRLPDKVQADVTVGTLSMGHARALLALENSDDLLEARDQVVKKGLSVRDTEALVKKIKSFGVNKPPKKSVESDPELRHLEERLQQELGTQVKIQRKGRGGKLEVRF